MNTWVKICRKQAICSYCKKPVLNKEFMVVAQHRRGKWKFRRCFHPECWLEQAKQELTRRDYTETRGSKRMGVDDETREKRFKILARRASVLQRLKKANEVQDITRMIHLGKMLGELREEIEPLGGAPESW